MQNHPKMKNQQHNFEYQTRSKAGMVKSRETDRVSTEIGAINTKPSKLYAWNRRTQQVFGETWKPSGASVCVCVWRDGIAACVCVCITGTRSECIGVYSFEGDEQARKTIWEGLIRLIKTKWWTGLWVGVKRVLRTDKTNLSFVLRVGFWLTG